MKNARGHRPQYVEGAKGPVNKHEKMAAEIAVHLKSPEGLRRLESLLRKNDYAISHLAVALDQELHAALAGMAVKHNEAEDEKLQPNPFKPDMLFGPRGKYHHEFSIQLHRSVRRLSLEHARRAHERLSEAQRRWDQYKAAKDSGRKPPK